MAHAPGTANLVIGGTGMLAEATRWVARRASVTILVARQASRFPVEGARLRPVDADWHAPDFAARVGAAITENGPVGRVLLWLHDPEPVLPWLLPLVDRARVVLVLGSLDGRPRLPDALGSVAVVRLGSMEAGGGRRWLSHAEISAGAIAALQDGVCRVVGELTPLP